MIVAQAVVDFLVDSLAILWRYFFLYPVLPVTGIVLVRSCNLFGTFDEQPELAVAGEQDLSNGKLFTVESFMELWLAAHHEDRNCVTYCTDSAPFFLSFEFNFSKKK